MSNLWARTSRSIERFSGKKRDTSAVRSALGYFCRPWNRESPCVHRMLIRRDTGDRLSFNTIYFKPVISTCSWIFSRRCETFHRGISPRNRKAFGISRDLSRNNNVAQEATFPVFWYSSRGPVAKSRAYNGHGFHVYPRIRETSRRRMKRSRIKHNAALNHGPTEWKLKFSMRTSVHAYANHLSTDFFPFLVFLDFPSSSRREFPCNIFSEPFVTFFDLEFIHRNKSASRWTNRANGGRFSNETRDEKKI